jgi:hypothetical protein
MPIVTAVATGDCSGLFRHDSLYGARPLVRYSDGHLGSSLPLLPDNPCVIGKTPIRNDLLVVIGVMALVSAAVVVESARRRRRPAVPAPPIDLDSARADADT